MSTISQNDFNRAIGAAINALRKARALSQKDLGDAIGVTFQQIQKYIKGVNQLSGYRLYQFAHVLGVSVAHLYEQAGAQVEAEECSPATNDGYLAARYVSKIADAKLRTTVIDFTRKLAYSAGEAA